MKEQNKNDPEEVKENVWWLYEEKWETSEEEGTVNDLVPKRL